MSSNYEFFINGDDNSCLFDDIEQLSKSELIGLIRAMRQCVNESVVSGVVVGKEFVEYTSVVFPGKENVVYDNIMKNARREMWALLSARYNAAVSGAMRWEWSQEAPITVSREWSYLYR